LSVIQAINAWNTGCYDPEYRMLMPGVCLKYGLLMAAIKAVNFWNTGCRLGYNEFDFLKK
jgi:hypothetical protein